MLTKEEATELGLLRNALARTIDEGMTGDRWPARAVARMIELERRDAMSWEPTEAEGTHKDGRFVELCCGEIEGRAHIIVGRWNIDAQDRAGWYGTDGVAIEGATHWRELSTLPGRE